MAYPYPAGEFVQMPEPVAYQQSSMKGPNVTKRIVVCCDGYALSHAACDYEGADSCGSTWQDGLVVSQRWKYTNVLVSIHA